MRFVVADITKANPGTEARLFDTLLRSVADQRHDVAVVCFESQAARVKLSHPTFKIEALSYGTHYSIIASRVRELLREVMEHASNEDSVLVLSFHAEVLKLRLELSSRLPARNEFYSWTTLWKMQSGQDTSFASPISSNTIEEATRVLLSALRKNGNVSFSTSTRQAELRFLDRKLSKQNPAVNVPGFITQLVKTAEEKRLIEVDRSDAINPRIWLPGTSSSELSVPNATQLRVQGSQPTTSRSEGFINSLKAIDLGPFSVIRPYLYDCLSEVMSNGPLTVRRVLADTVERTRTKCNEANLRTNNYPWRKVRQFLINLMSRRPVLLNAEDQPVVPSFITLSQEVVVLKENWREDLEGELILALIESGAEIELVDIPLLAGALYFSREAEDEEQVDKTISYLVAKGLLGESERRLVLRRLERPTGDNASSQVLSNLSPANSVTPSVLEEKAKTVAGNGGT